MSEVSHMICEGGLLLHFVHSLLWSCSNTMGPCLFTDTLKNHTTTQSLATKGQLISKANFKVFI